MAPPHAPVSMCCITTAPMDMGFVAGLRSGLAAVLNSCDLCCVAGVSRAVWGIVAVAAGAALCAGLFGRRRWCPSHTGAGVVLFETELWGMSATAESETADVCRKAPGRVRRACVCVWMALASLEIIFYCSHWTPSARPDLHITGLVE